MKSTIKPAGERIALLNTEEAYSGKIQLPENRQRTHVHGLCIAVGDGKRPDGTQAEIYAKVGDVYLYQIDAQQKINGGFTIEDQFVLLLHQADMICRLTDPVVSLATIEMVGHWLLVEPHFAKQGAIIVPETATDAQHELHHFRLIKQGSLVTLGMEVGDEVFPARGRLTPLAIDGTIYCFIQDAFLYGHIPAVTPA